MSFRELAILDDGRAVGCDFYNDPTRTTSEWFIGGLSAGVLDYLRQPDACLGGDGRVWIAGTSQADPMRAVALVVSLGAFASAFDLGPGFGNRACIIQPEGNGVRVAWTSAADEWSMCLVTASGVVPGSVTHGPIKDGSGANGLCGFVLGEPEPRGNPPDFVVGRYALRWAVGAASRHLGALLGNYPDQAALVEADGSVKTLKLGAWDVFRLSTSGEYFALSRFSPAANHIGKVPADLPAPVPNPPPPAFPPQTFAPIGRPLVLGSFAAKGN